MAKSDFSYYFHFKDLTLYQIISFPC